MMSKLSITQDCEAVIYLKNKDPRLGRIIERIGDIECNVHNDDFSFIIEEIVGQMLSNKVATVICTRLYTLCNNNISPESIMKLSVEELRGIGISKSKIQCIRCFSEGVISGDIPVNMFQELPDDKVFKILTSVKGIGPWTAKMYLLFVKQSLDVLPYEDGAFLQTYRWLYDTQDVSPSSVKKQCECWSPYSSIGARYFYRALDMGFTNEKMCKEN